MKGKEIVGDTKGKEIVGHMKGKEIVGHTKGKGGDSLSHETGMPMYFGEVQCPKGAMTEAQKGLRERNMSLYSVRNYLLGFRRISGVFGAKKADFRRLAEDGHPW